MSKLQVGRRYVTRNGKTVHLFGGTASPQSLDGTIASTGPKTEVYHAKLEDGTGEVDYGPDGKAIGAQTDDLEIVDMVAEDGVDARSVAPVQGAPAPAQPGEGVAIKATGDSVPERDDDPVHPQDDDEVRDILRGHPPTFTPTLADVPVPKEIETLVQAVLDGKTVQWKRSGNTEWEDLRSKAFAIRMLMQPGHTGNEFRLRPDPVPKFVPLFRNGKVGTGVERFEDTPDAGWGVVTVVKLWIAPDNKVVAHENLYPRPKPGSFGAA